MSVGAIARVAGLPPAIGAAAYAIALAIVLVAAFGRGVPPVARASATPRWLGAVGTAGIVAYAAVAGALIAATTYHSDSVVAAHGAARLLLEGRHPYADFDLVRELARFGLPETFATPLEDGTRLRSFQYPALTFLVPAPLIAAGVPDIRGLYLAEVLGIFTLVILSVPRAWRALALLCAVANAAILLQFVDAGVDPLWALLVLAAWLVRRHPAAGVLLGLAIAARQPAWLVAPFLIAWTAQRLGVRAGATRAAVALLVAFLIHLPFLIGAPGDVIRGITDPALLPLEPWGIGPAKLAADGLGPLLPRIAYLAAAGLAYLVALWAFATRRARGALTLPLLPLWIAWRALESYFAFLPLFLLTDQQDP